MHRKHNALVSLVGLVALSAIIIWTIPAPQPTEAEPEPEPTLLTCVDKPTTTATAEAPSPKPDPREVELIGRTIWGEAGGVENTAERAAVAWCILNRVDERGQTVEEVVTAPEQFHGYRATGDCPQEHLDLAADVLTRWQAEKDGATEVGRVLPGEYQYFVGDGERNHFTAVWRSAVYWDWSLPSPY